MITHSKPTIGKEEIKAAAHVLKTGHLNSGEIKVQLERQIANDTGYPEAIAVSSASIGIFLILKSRFPAGKAKIALPSYVCRSVWDAVVMADCIPVLYDIDTDTFAIDVTKIDIGNVDIVIIAHLFGIRAEFEYLVRNNIEIIEDCAQRIAPMGTSSELMPAWRIYSFDPTKIITGGQGGVILGTNTDNIRAIRQMVDGEYVLNSICIKAPFTDIQASIALTQWNKLGSFLETRKQIAEFYTASIANKNSIHPAMGKKDTWHFRYLIKSRSPEKLIHEMEQRGIICRKPVHPFGLHRLFSVAGEFTNTETATNTIVSLPIYPSLSEEDQHHIIHSLNECYES